MRPAIIRGTVRALTVLEVPLEPPFRISPTDKKSPKPIYYQLRANFTSVLPPNFRFLCTLSVRDCSDTVSCDNGGTPLKPTQTSVRPFGSRLRGCFCTGSMKIRTNHLLSVKSPTRTTPRQSLFHFNEQTITFKARSVNQFLNGIHGVQVLNLVDIFIPDLRCFVKSNALLYPVNLLI